MAKHHPGVTPERIAEAAARLRPIERDVLLLATRKGLSPREIGARLRIAPATAQHILARALYKLDRALERRERSWWRLW